MYRAFSNKLPHNMQSYFTKSFSGNEYRTRQKNCFKQKYARITTRKYCLPNIGVKVRNNVDENIKSYNKLNSLKRTLKDHIINSN